MGWCYENTQKLEIKQDIYKYPMSQRQRQLKYILNISENENKTSKVL